MSKSTSNSSEVSIVHIQNILENLKAKQTRNSTMRNYLSIWRSFNRFLLRLDIPRGGPNLSWEQRAVLYGTYLVDQGAQSQTVKSYFLAIKHVLKMDGYAWDDSLAALDIITKGCKLENDQLKIRLPIKLGLLEQILFEVEHKFESQPYLHRLYKALFSAAYYGLMRIGELTASCTVP